MDNSLKQLKWSLWYKSSRVHIHYPGWHSIMLYLQLNGYLKHACQLLSSPPRDAPQSLLHSPSKITVNLIYRSGAIWCVPANSTLSTVHPATREALPGDLERCWMFLAWLSSNYCHKCKLLPLHRPNFITQPSRVLDTCLLQFEVHNNITCSIARPDQQNTTIHNAHDLCQQSCKRFETNKLSKYL